MKLARVFIPLTLFIGVSVLPASAHHAFWHQVKDQISGAHQRQYGYGNQWNYSYNRHKKYNPYYGTNSGYGNYWGPSRHAVKDSQHAQQEYRHAAEDAHHASDEGQHY